jgi:hypothetical protein
VTTKTGSFFYLPDVADLPDATQTLHGTDIYVGDGATITRSMVRKRNGSLIGHAAIDVQLGWCERAGVRQAIFTHCGSYIVRGDGRIVNSMVQQLGRARGVNARLACDGDQLTV